ncbi:MAG: hypothetical protein ACTSQC_11245 [Candidatus Heimdallarchaeaceae archaeon]
MVLNLEKRKPKYINEDGYEVYQSENGKDYTIVTYDEFELQSKGPNAKSVDEWKKYYTEWKDNYPKSKQDSKEYKRMCQLFEKFIEKTEIQEKRKL